jgi:citrate synthase
MTLVIAGLTAYIADDPALMPSFTGRTVYHKNADRVDKAVVDTVAAVGAVVAVADCHRTGTTFTPASPERTFYENLFVMMGRVDQRTGNPDPKRLSCFRRWGNVIPDHGITNSTFSLRVTASSLADPVSCLISSLATACGPLHFGAQEAAFRTTMAVRVPQNVPALIERAKSGESRLHGIGHRSYNVVDPRIGPMLGLLRELGTENIPYLNVAEEIDRITSVDEYFTKRNLKPNADLYNQFFYVAL